MNKTFNIGRLVFNLGIAKSGLWCNDKDTHWFHIGTFTDGKQTALKVIVLPFSLMVGWAGKHINNG